MYYNNIVVETDVIFDTKWKRYMYIWVIKYHDDWCWGVFRRDIFINSGSCLLSEPVSYMVTADIVTTAQRELNVYTHALRLLSPFSQLSSQFIVYTTLAPFPLRWSYRAHFSVCIWFSSLHYFLQFWLPKNWLNSSPEKKRI